MKHTLVREMASISVLKGKQKYPWMTLSPKIGVEHVVINTLGISDTFSKYKMPIYIVFPPDRDSNRHPDSLISAAEMSDYCGPISLVWYCQFDISPVNYSDSDSDLTKMKYLPY